MAIRTLYLAYFGLREPLVQTQVLPYLRQLVAAHVEVNLLTFEREFKRHWTEGELRDERSRLTAEGINWFHLKYHKRPSLPATIYDTLAGAWVAMRLARKHRIDVLHARAHVAMAMALLAHAWTGCFLVFDFRGLVAEEYVDAEIWQEGSLPFRLVKLIERLGLRRADQIVVLTRRMRDWLIERGQTAGEKIQVIPCCVDPSRFDLAAETCLANNRFEVVYAGSVTGLYMLEEMGRFFLELRAQQPGAFLRILTLSSSQEARARLERLGVNPGELWVGTTSSADLPTYLRRARLGLSFRRGTFSQIAASPTKIAEYLISGLPVVSNAGTGDVDELLSRERVGVTLEGFGREAYARAAERALSLAKDPEIQKRCRRAARLNFDLVSVGGKGYLEVYSRLRELQTNQDS